MRGGFFVSLPASVSVVIALFALTGYEVTNATAGPRLLGRLAAAIIELDRWLPAHAQDLQLAAGERPQARVRPELPVAVSLPADRVATADAAALARLITAAAGEALYRDGVAAFQTADGSPASLSATEPARWAVAGLNEDAHGFWRATLILSLVGLLAVVAALLLGGRSLFPPFAAGGLVAALGALVVWLGAAAVSGVPGSAADREIVLILRDGAWIGVRNAAAVAAAGAAMLVLSSALGRQEERTRQRGWRASSSPPPDTPFQR